MRLSICDDKYLVQMHVLEIVIVATESHQVQHFLVILHTVFNPTFIQPHSCYHSATITLSRYSVVLFGLVVSYNFNEVRAVLIRPAKYRLVESATR